MRTEIKTKICQISPFASIQFRSKQKITLANKHQSLNAK